MQKEMVNKCLWHDQWLHKIEVLITQGCLAGPAGECVLHTQKCSVS